MRSMRISGCEFEFEFLQDLVEVLSKPWYVGRKIDQARFERDEAGNLIKEATIPFEYHDGYLSVYYQSNNYQEVEKELSPLQEEALWCAAACHAFVTPFSFLSLFLLLDDSIFIVLNGGFVSSG